MSTKGDGTNERFFKSITRLHSIKYFHDASVCKNVYDVLGKEIKDEI